MDVVTIVSTALGAANQALRVGNYIYVFIQRTKNVDRTVRLLAEEVSALGEICKSISEQITALPPPITNDRLLLIINTRITECSGPIARIEQALKDVQQEHSSFTRQAVRQWRLNLSQDEINTCRTHIQNNSANLQLSLQLLVLKATFLAPQIANDALLSKLDELTAIMQKQSQKFDRALLGCATSYLSAGRSLYEQSIASSSSNAGYSPRPRNAAVENWFLTLGSLENPAAAAAAEHRSTPSVRTSEGGSGNWQLNQDESMTTVDEEAQTDTESQELDHGLELDLTDAAFKAGHDAFDNEDYREAESMLCEGLAYLQKLPPSLRKGHDLEAIRYRLAVCAYHQHDTSNAEAALISVVEKESVSRADAVQKMEAALLLSAVYVKQNKLNRAQATNENVYRTQRKLQGKDADACYRSIGLAVRIYTLQDNQSRATAHQKLLPPERREEFCQMFDTLEIEHRTGHASNRALDSQTVSSLQTVVTAPLQPASSVTGDEPYVSLASPTINSNTMSTLTTTSWWYDWDIQDINDKIYAISLSKDSQIAIVSTKDTLGPVVAVVMLDQDYNMSLKDIFRTESVAEHLAISSDKVTYALSYKRGTTIDIHSLKSGAHRRTLVLRENEFIKSLAFAPIQEPLLCSLHPSSMRIWNADTGEKIRRENATSASWTNKGHVIYANDSYTGVIDALNRERISTRRIPFGQHHSIEDSVFADEDGTLTATQMTDWIQIVDRWNKLESLSLKDFYQSSSRPGGKPGPKDWIIKAITFLSDGELICIALQGSKSLAACEMRSDKTWWWIDTGHAEISSIWALPCPHNKMIMVRFKDDSLYMIDLELAIGEFRSKRDTYDLRKLNRAG